MKILLLDDNFDRINKISGFAESRGLQIVSVYNLDGARKELQQNNYDIFIIDLYVPISYSKKTIEQDSGLRILNEIFNKKNLIRPTNIIVISDHLKEISYLNELMALPVSILSTNESYDWIETLGDLFDKICCHQVDIAIITATDTEFNAIYDDKWLKDIEIGGLTFYKKFFLQNNTNALLVQTENMGMISASYLMSSLFKYYDPRKVIMIGVIAGNPNDTKLGDIIVANRSYDYSSGAIKEDDNGEPIFESDPIAVEANEKFVNIFKSYEAKGIMNKIKSKVNYFFCEEEYNEIKKDCRDASIKIGYVATGPSVVKCKKYREMFIEKFYRKYLGIDMETYPVYYFCKKKGSVEFLSIKSVCDNADKSKRSVYQPYCAKLATEILYYYIENDLTNMQ